MRLFLLNIFLAAFCLAGSLWYSFKYNHELKFGFQPVSITETTESDIINIPLIRVGKLLLIEAKIDDKIGNLVFDTGSAGLVLNSTYFRDYVKTENSVSQGITGSIGSTHSITTDSICFGDLLYRNVRADLVDLGHIENSRGIRVYGLIGFSHLRNYEVIIDIQNSQLTLIRVDRKGNKLNNSDFSFKPDVVESIEESNNIVFFTGKVAGKPVKFCLDTGAEISSISTSLPRNILNTISITRRTSLMGAGAVRRDVLFGIINDFKLGSKSYDGMETIITNLSSLESVYNKQFGGVVGYEFLSKGIVSINIRKKQMGICYYNTEEK